MGASNYQQSTQDGTVINTFTGMPSEWEPTSPAGSIEPAGGGGFDFNWQAAIGGMLQGVGAGLASVGGSYGHVGAGILGGSQQLIQSIDDDRKIEYLQEAAEVDRASWKRKVEDKMSLERAEYQWQLEQLKKNMAGFVAIAEQPPADAPKPSASQAAAAITAPRRTPQPPLHNSRGNVTPPQQERAI
jgi:hypothetical protein